MQPSQAFLQARAALAEQSASEVTERLDAMRTTRASPIATSY